MAEEGKATAISVKIFKVTKLEYLGHKLLKVLLYNRLNDVSIDVCNFDTEEGPSYEYHRQHENIERFLPPEPRHNNPKKPFQLLNELSVNVSFSSLCI